MFSIISQTAITFEQKNDLFVNEIINVDIFSDYSNSFVEEVDYIIDIDNVDHQTLLKRHNYINNQLIIDY